MSGKTEISQINAKKFPSPKKYSKKGVSPQQSVFNGEDYEFERSTGLSETRKLYKGEPSKYDNLNPKKEYHKPTNTKKKQVESMNESYPSSSVFNKDDYEFEYPAGLSEAGKLYKGQPSKFDNIGLKEEYYKLFRDGKSKQDETAKSADSGDDRYYLSEDRQVYVSSPLPEQMSKTPVIKDEAQLAQDDAEKIDLALAIAEDFAKREKLIIVGGAIYIYNGKFYAMLTEDEARYLIFQKYRQEISRASPVTVLRNAVFLLKLSAKKMIDEFPVNSHLIVFGNGTLEIGTGRFRNNSAEDLVSSALGIDYDSSHWEMPHTQNFLETIADSDDDLYELMLQVIGYILSNDIRAKSFFYLEGVGDAGKSRFCDLIASFFPASGANKVARIALQDLGGKFELGNLVNAKLNISEDLPDSPLSPTTVSRIKMISDSNRLEAEAKYVQAFSFKPQCKLLFASNHPLRLKEYDAAFERRVVFIPFYNAIPKHKQDTKILEKMQGELPALFNHAFAAYKRLVANGYAWAGAEKFKPDICIVNSGISFDKEQILKRFVDMCCVIEEDAVTPTSDIQDAYQRFCDENQYPPIRGDRFSRDLAAVLPSTVSRVKIGNQRRGFKGIKLQNAHEFNGF